MIFQRLNDSASPSRRRAGFSLVELLAVISIIVVLTGLTGVSVNHLGQSRSLARAGGDIADVLSSARIYAMAHNTYVWVEVSAEADDLEVSVWASRNGTESTTPADRVRIDRVRTYPQIAVVNLPASLDRPVPADTAHASLSPGETLSIRFNRRGELSADPLISMRALELGLQESANGVPRNPANFAAVQVLRLTGAVSLYQP